MKTTLNALWQKSRRLYFAFRTPAIYLGTINRSSVFAGFLKSVGIVLAPSRAQIGAMRRSLQGSEIYFYRRLFRMLEFDSQSLIIDIGANIGYTAMAFSQALESEGKSAKMILVEPNWKNFPFLSFNLRKLKLENWSLLPFGVSTRLGFKQAGILESYSWRGNSAFHNTGLVSFANHAMRSNTLMNLPLVDVPTFQAFLGPEGSAEAPPLFCKIDIEGGEYDFLQASSDWFESNSTVFQVEINPIFENSRKIVDFAEQYEYVAIPRGETSATHELFLFPKHLREAAISVAQTL